MRRAWRKRLRGDDAGFSLMEVVVGMSLMSVLMVVLLGAIVQSYSNVTRAENTSSARDQLDYSFKRLDKELRYATSISSPETCGTNNTAQCIAYSMADGCRQLKYAGDVLSWGKWDPATDTEPKKYEVVVEHAALNAGAPIFTRISPHSPVYGSQSPGVGGVGSEFMPEYYQIRLQLKVAVGKVSLPMDVLFTAQNTNGDTQEIC